MSNDNLSYSAVAAGTLILSNTLMLIFFVYKLSNISSFTLAGKILNLDVDMVLFIFFMNLLILIFSARVYLTLRFNDEWTAIYTILNTFSTLLFFSGISTMIDVEFSWIIYQIVSLIFTSAFGLSVFMWIAYGKNNKSVGMLAGILITIFLTSFLFIPNNVVEGSIILLLCLVNITIMLVDKYSEKRIVRYIPLIILVLSSANYIVYLLYIFVNLRVYENTFITISDLLFVFAFSIIFITAILKEKDDIKALFDFLGAMIFLSPYSLTIIHIPLIILILSLQLIILFGPIYFSVLLCWLLVGYLIPLIMQSKEDLTKISDIIHNYQREDAKKLVIEYLIERRNLQMPIILDLGYSWLISKLNKKVQK
ncbi:MAG: hypothetical protein ACP6IQ_07940 [Candidatus Njordarchaeia archaeon]